jgi:hypothetical protein
LPCSLPLSMVAVAQSAEGVVGLGAVPRWR